MDEDQFKDRVKRLQEINKVIEKLDPAIRAEAFSLLSDYATGAESPHKQQRKNGGAGGKAAPEDDEDRETFFSRHEHDKPSDNADLLAAYHFKEYGSAGFSLAEIRELAAAVGVTVPERIDMTFKQATHDGKKLYQSAGRGMYKPTVHGEAFFKKTYSVSKGRKKKGEEEA